MKKNLPERDSLKKQIRDKKFDLLVIGGGATGCGIALEAASRGLSVALVEREDFASGASSRSTKLVHGGVRYLEQAVTHLDLLQYHLVQDALRERATFFRNAPFLTQRLPILTPIYRWHEVPYYWFGLKVYDWISGRGSLGKSRYLSREKALQRFPKLRAKKLRGAVVYYDGQFNDSRMATLLALTAIREGAIVLNHCEATSLLKMEGSVYGGKIVDNLSKEVFEVRAKQVVNATGPFCDAIRKLDDHKARPLVQPSSGTHLLLPGKYCPTSSGMLIPNTRDNRILFLLPWEGHAIAGTTDQPANVSRLPKPTEEEISFILEHLSDYFGQEIPRTDVRAAWSGLRPLVASEVPTANLSRDHLIEKSSSGLMTITGGKWTTYRKMAEEVVDTLSSPHKSRTDKLPLIGTEGYSKNLSLEIQRDYDLPRESARHLSRAYGGQAKQLLEEAEDFELLTNKLPYLRAEVRYACRHEHACTAIDLIAHRTRIAFIDQQAALDTLTDVCTLMALELNWDELRVAQEIERAEDFLKTMKG